MNWPALSRHASRLSIGLAAALVASWMARQVHLERFTAADVEGLSSLISLIGGIYAVVFAFVIFVIWGQFTGVEDATVRECSLLNDLLRFAQFLDQDTNRVIRRAVSDYARRVANSEWHSLGEGREDQGSEKAFALVAGAIVHAAPASPTEQSAHQRLIDIMRKLAEQRDERIAKSLTRIPTTLLLLVRTMVALLLLLIFVYPFHSWMVGALGFSAVAIVLFFSNLVMTDTDNPFDGVFNVSAKPFSDLAA
jgi:Protein of unknown function (DUF4239)